MYNHIGHKVHIRLNEVLTGVVKALPVQSFQLAQIGLRRISWLIAVMLGVLVVMLGVLGCYRIGAHQQQRSEYRAAYYPTG